MSNWGRVYYTNLLSGLALLVVFPICRSEHKLLQETHFSHPQVFLLLLSCAVGVCMSHAGGGRLGRTAGRKQALLEKQPTVHCSLAILAHLAPAEAMAAAA
eukprot:GHRQ01019855.1.p4 GENE.GHRQ01019855.1~~GHRQ01019855.1.p4  ORF type:complete len:101 (-),score=40.17 GHRQ01019855.1:149-451(-)